MQIIKKIKEYKLLIVFLLFILLSSGVFRFLDHKFQNYFGLNKFINIFDFIFLFFLSFFILKKRDCFSRNTWLVIFYIILARLSILFSQDQLHHKAFYDLFRLSLIWSLFFIFSTSFFHKNKEILIKGFLVVFFTIALFESLVGIMQFFLQKPLGFHFIKEPIFGINLRRSAMVHIASNKFSFFKYISQNGKFLRAHGTFGHPNIFSGFLNISSLLTLYLIYKTKKKYLFNLFLLIQLGALILTFSRAGIMSFLCSSFVFFSLMLIKKYNVKKMSLIFFSVIIFLGSIFSKQFIERGFLGSFFQSKQAKELNVKSGDTRKCLQTVALNMIKKNLFWGIGFRNFLVNRDKYINLEKIPRAYVHNIYLLILAETGVFAFCIFFILIFIIFKDIWIGNLNPLSITSLCIVISFLLIGIFDHYPISSHFGRMCIFFFLGFLNYLIIISRPLSYSQKVFLYQ